MKQLFLLFLLSFGINLNVLATDTKIQAITCSGCEAKDRLLTCSKCNVAKYCNQSCQQNHLSMHEQECHILKAKALFEKFYYFSLEVPEDQNSPTAIFVRSITKDGAAAARYVELMINELKKNDAKTITFLRFLEQELFQAQK